MLVALAAMQLMAPQVAAAMAALVVRVATVVMAWVALPAAMAH